MSCYGLVALTMGAAPCKPHSKSSELCDIQQGGFLIIREIMQRCELQFHLAPNAGVLTMQKMQCSKAWALLSAEVYFICNLFTMPKGGAPEKSEWNAGMYL